MKIPTRSTSSNITLASQAKSEERESWHNLVVKIITWKDGPIQESDSKLAYKITAAEWKTYSKHVTDNNTSKSIENLLATLNETREIITKNGGFA